MKKENIYLIGFMGSGKSTIGQELAALLSYEWMDLDKMIIERNQKSVAQIFSDYGEDYFRKEERLVLHSTQHLEKSLISCGGGTPCFFDNMKWINKHGISIFLDPPKEILVNRLTMGKEKRPLLKGLTLEGLGSFIEKKMEERRFFYEQAKIHYKQEKIDQEVGKELLQEIINYLA